MMSSNGNIFRVTGHLCGEFTGPRWVPRTKASDNELWCFFICVWINDWVNNREAGDLRRYRSHYDVIVMDSKYFEGMTVYYSGVKMGAMVSQITGVPIVHSTVFFQAQIKNIKAPRHWPWWRESTGHWWIPLIKASNMNNVFISWRHPLLNRELKHLKWIQLQRQIFELICVSWRCIRQHYWHSS